MIEWKTLQMYLAIFAVYMLGGWYAKMVNDIVALGGVALIGMIFFYYEFFVYRKYPVIVPLFIKRKGRWSFKLDMASRKRDENKVEYYQLRSTKKKAKPPKFENIIETVKGYVLPLFSPTQDEYREVKIDDSGKIEVIDEDMKQWYKYWTKKSYSDWAPELSLWARYQPIVGMAVLGGIVIVIMYIMAGQLPMWTAEFSRVTAELVRAAESLGGMTGGAIPPH